MRSMLVLAVSAASLAACGGDDKQSAAEAPPAQTQTAKSAKPERRVSGKAGKEKTCLIRGGAADVEQRGKDLWRGSTGDFLLVIGKEGSDSKAASVVKDATLVEAKAAGLYTINGGLKGNGSAEAVGIVADCLRRG